MKELGSEKMTCHGHEVEISHPGTGRFGKSVMCDKDGNELYSVCKEISKQPSEKDRSILRKEVFRNAFSRGHKGEESTFIDFCREVAKLQNFPKSIDYYPVIAKLKLNVKTGIVYTAYYEKFFGNKK